MPPSSVWTRDTATELIRTLAAANGGHLNSREFTRNAPAGAPSFITMYRLFGVNSWPDICTIVGIYQTYGETLPDVLDEDLIREVIRRNYKGATMYSEAHRQQVALWCLSKATLRLGNGFTKAQYDAIAPSLGLYGSWMVAAAFNDSWNLALQAAGIYVPSPKKLGEERKRYQKITRTDERQEDIINTLKAESVPADWRTQEHGMPVCAVTQVTQVYRHVTVAEYGLRCEEIRMVLR